MTCSCQDRILRKPMLIIKILPTSLHCLIDDKGRVHVYTEKEYNTISILNPWWKRMKSKYFGHE